jgi:hypothetical protein
MSVQRDATVSSLYFISLQDYCTCFGCSLHPSSRVHRTADATTGTSHMMWQVRCYKVVIDGFVTLLCRNQIWVNLFRLLGCSCNIQIFRATGCLCSFLHANCCFCFKCYAYYPVSMFTKQAIFGTCIKISYFIFVKLYLCAVDNYRIVIFFLNSGVLSQQFTFHYLDIIFHRNSFFEVNTKISPSLFFPFFSCCDVCIM